MLLLLLLLKVSVLFVLFLEHRDCVREYTWDKFWIFSCFPLECGCFIHGSLLTVWGIVAKIKCSFVVLDWNECRGICGAFGERELLEVWEEDVSVVYHWGRWSNSESLVDWQTDFDGCKFMFWLFYMPWTFWFWDKNVWENLGGRWKAYVKLFYLFKVLWPCEVTLELVVVVVCQSLH